MASMKLKPCPFCGAEARLVKWETNTEDYYYITCDNDCCKQAKSSLTAEKAIAKWNRRAVEVE